MAFIVGDGAGGSDRDRSLARARNRLEIGFINNMAPSAQRATQHMFASILRDAASDHDVHLKLYSTRRPVDGKDDPSRLEALWGSRLDALIVTGAEPRAASPREEPNWNILTEIVDWAAKNTLSTFWSCLAAHSAVLHLDGLARRPLEQKCSGVFDCYRVADHALLRNMPAQITMPHSRHNSLSAAALAALDYRVLTCLGEGDADLFVRQFDSLFVFAQGHPEYEATTLLREYRRDVRRFLEHERDIYPEMPRSYFDAETAALLREFRARATGDQPSASMSDFPERAAEQGLHAPWRNTAVTLWRNWLDTIAAEKLRRQPSRAQLERSSAG